MSADRTATKRTKISLTATRDEWSCIFAAATCGIREGYVPEEDAAKIQRVFEQLAGMDVPLVEAL